MLRTEPERFLKVWEEILADAEKSANGDIELDNLVKVVSRKAQMPVPRAV
jgi:hypothetical protein